MGRVIAPLEEMGAQFKTADGLRLPITVSGAIDALPFSYEVPVPSAQVKSAVLLAALNTSGTTTIIEPVPTRDHTENMLRNMGAQIEVSKADDGSCHIALTGPAELKATDIVVPGDPSSASFPVVAALITPGSALTVESVMLNPMRTGLFKTLQEMGGKLRFTGHREVGGESVADIEVSYSELTGVDVPAERAPSMIDEYPILAVAAAAAKGTTVMNGLVELRVKETDRLEAIAAGLSANGVEVLADDDSLTIVGTNGHIPGGGLVATHMDHRIAMSFLVMGCVAETPVDIDEDAMIATSFPEFFDLMTSAGAVFAELDGAES
jgi:3-phosphoshikimate 1-carboxyvinyltransferase